MAESNDNMEDKTSSIGMVLAKYNPMRDEDKKNTDEKGPKNITGEEAELKHSSSKVTKVQLKQGLLSPGEKSKSVGDTPVSHCSLHDKRVTSAEDKHIDCNEHKNGRLEPVVHTAVNHGEYPENETKGMIKERSNTSCSDENSLPRFYAAQAAASKSNVEQAAAAAAQPASPAAIERQKYLKDKGFRVRFSEDISYRSPSPSKHEDEDDDVEEIGRGQRIPEEFFFSDEDDITEYIAWSNSIKNKYGHASPGTFDYFRVRTAGTVPAVGSSVSAAGVKDPYDHGWAKKLNIPARKHGSIGRIDYSKVQKAGARGFFSLDGADDSNGHEWDGKLELSKRQQHGRSITVDDPRLQTAFTGLTAGRSCSLDGVRDPFDLGWAQKLHIRPRRQQDQDRGTSEYYIVPEADQTVNGEQSRRYDPAHMEHLQHTSEYHKAITDVHHTTQRRLEQPQPQVQSQVQQSQQQPVGSRPSIRSPFNFFRRDQHSKDCYDAPDVVRSPVQGPIQGHSHGPDHGAVQGTVQAPVQSPSHGASQVRSHGPSHGHSQGHGNHRRQYAQPARPANIPSSFRGAVLSPNDLSRARSRYREHTLPQQPYVNNPGPPQFVSPGSQPIDTTMRHRNAPMMNVRSLGVIDKAYLGPQYQTPAAGPGQQPAYPAAAFNQYPNPNAGPAQHHGIPAPAQYYQPAAAGPRPYAQAAGPVQFPATYGYPYNSGPVPYSGVPVPAQFYQGASHGAHTPAGPIRNHPGAAAAPQMYGQTRANQANFGAPPRTFVQTTPAQRHPSAVFPGQIRQDAPVEHYNSEGFEGAFAQTTPSQHHPPAAIPGAPAAHAGPGPTQYISNAAGAFSQGIPAGPTQYRQAHAAAPVAPVQHHHQYQNRPAAATPGGLTRATTQKALPPTPTSQQSSSSHVSSSTSQTPLSATRHTPAVPSNQMSHSVHRRSASTAPSTGHRHGHGHGQGHGHGHGHGYSYGHAHRHSSVPRPTSVGPSAQPHFFRPDFNTMDPVTVQGHGRDVMMRDARFFVNRDRDVSLQNMVSDRTVATTGQNHPSSSTTAASSREDMSVRPRGTDSRDRWAEQNLNKQEEHLIANVMRQPAQKKQE